MSSHGEVGTVQVLGNRAMSSVCFGILGRICWDTSVASVCVLVVVIITCLERGPSTLTRNKLLDKNGHKQEQITKRRFRVPMPFRFPSHSPMCSFNLRAHMLPCGHTSLSLWIRLFLCHTSLCLRFMKNTSQ